MWKKLLIISLCISVLFVFSAPITPVDAGNKSIIVNWNIVGTIVQNIDVESLLFGDNTIGPRSLINLSAQGAPGPAKITLLSASEPCSDQPFPCESGYDIIGACFTKNDMVAIFPDQSLLFASIDDVGGVLCLNLNFGTTPPLPEDGTYFKIQMNVKGGTGRYEGASGSLTGEGHAYFIENPTGDPYDYDLTLLGENGKITGTIHLP